MSVWINIQGTSAWDINGSTGTNPSTNFLGTTDSNGIDFMTNSNTAMTILPTSLIGIGETNPTTALHLKGASPLLRLNNGIEGLNKVLLSDANGVANWTDNSILSSGDFDWIFSSGSTLSDPVYHEGLVSIGTTTLSVHPLDVDNGALTDTTFGIGDVEFITDGNFATQFSHNLVPEGDASLTLGSTAFRWNTIYAVNGTVQTSDANLKQDIKPLEYGVSSLMKLKPVSYYWKQDKHHYLDTPINKKELKIGFIAQELQKIIPEVVYTHSWKKKSEQEPNVYVRKENELIGVNYEELIPVLVKAKQEQHMRITCLTMENEKLIKELEALIEKQ